MIKLEQSANNVKTIFTYLPDIIRKEETLPMTNGCRNDNAIQQPLKCLIYSIKCKTVFAIMTTIYSIVCAHAKIRQENVEEKGNKTSSTINHTNHWIAGICVMVWKDNWKNSKSAPQMYPHRISPLVALGKSKRQRRRRGEKKKERNRNAGKEKDKNQNEISECSQGNET